MAYRNNPYHLPLNIKTILSTYHALYYMSIGKNASHLFKIIFFQGKLTFFHNLEFILFILFILIHLIVLA